MRFFIINQGLKILIVFKFAYFISQPSLNRVGRTPGADTRNPDRYPCTGLRTSSLHPDPESSAQNPVTYFAICERFEGIITDTGNTASGFQVIHHRNKCKILWWHSGKSFLKNKIPSKFPPKFRSFTYIDFELNDSRTCKSQGSENSTSNHFSQMSKIWRHFFEISS